MKILMIIVALMLIMALFVIVFDVGYYNSFFDVSTRLVRAVSNTTGEVVKFLPIPFLDFRDLSGYDDESLCPFDEFYLLRLSFGKEDEYYVDLALPDTNVKEWFVQDFYFLDSNYPGDVWISEAEVLTNELLIYAKPITEERGKLYRALYFNKKYNVVWVTEVEYLSNYYGQPDSIECQ